MVMVEFKEASYEKAFGLLDEIKELGKQKKMALCKLEDAIYECYEESKKGEDDSDEDVNFRNYRMRKNMRYDDDMEDDDDDMQMRAYRRSRGMRMRRSRSGRYSY